MRTIRRAHITDSDPVVAARTFHEQVRQPDMALVLFFCSSRYDLDALTAELNRLFVDVVVVGCTTAGEIGEQGYHNHSISGLSFPAESFTAVSASLGPLQSFEVTETRNRAQELKRHLMTQKPADLDGAAFAFLMIDGMSQREETLIGALHNSLGEIPLVGGSAGDNLGFEQTFVFHGGRFHSDHAVLILVHTACPFMVSKTQHFTATDERLVITGAEPGRRRVTEINGLPAAREYARLTDVDVNDLNPDRFASSPVVVLVNGREYVRSIQQANDDGSLTFYCAIEEGLVIRVARGVDLIENLEAELERIARQLGAPQAIVACDCVLRKLELGQRKLEGRAGDLARTYNVVGFNSYGEQVEGVHVNQTFTALAIGPPEGEDRA